MSHTEMLQKPYQPSRGACFKVTGFRVQLSRTATQAVAMMGVCPEAAQQKELDNGDRYIDSTGL
jgi:hypothetical protein